MGIHTLRQNLGQLDFGWTGKRAQPAPAAVQKPQLEGFFNVITVQSLHDEAGHQVHRADGFTIAAVDAGPFFTVQGAVQLNFSVHKAGKKGFVTVGLFNPGLRNPNISSSGASGRMFNVFSKNLGACPGPLFFR